MNAKEKANELFKLHEDAIYEKLTYTGDGEEAVLLAKTAALITVDWLIEQFKKSDSLYATRFLADYWSNVKVELKCL
jgi:hypothetical protein